MPASPPAREAPASAATPAAAAALAAAAGLAEVAVAMEAPGAGGGAGDASDHHPVSSLLLGVPDRSSTASAPPDLEISSRSLFAFKADYSGIFSDIRLDEHYESFYNENPERLKLPPPLPPDARHTSSSSSSSSVTNTATTAATMTAAAPITTAALSTSAAATASSTAATALLAHSQQTQQSSHDHAKFNAHSAHQQHQHLTREDSDASFDDLIFRETRALRALQSPLHNASTTPLYRDDAFHRHQNTTDQHPPPPPLPSSSSSSSQQQQRAGALGTLVQTHAHAQTSSSTAASTDLNVTASRESHISDQDSRVSVDDFKPPQSLQQNIQSSLRITPQTSEHHEQPKTSSQPQPLESRYLPPRSTPSALHASTSSTSSSSSALQPPPPAPSPPPVVSAPSSTQDLKHPPQRQQQTQTPALSYDCLPVSHVEQSVADGLDTSSGHLHRSHTAPLHLAHSQRADHVADEFSHLDGHSLAQQHGHQFGNSSHRSHTRTHAHNQQQSQPLWRQLDNLGLDDPEPSGGNVIPPRDVYSSISTPYSPSDQLLSPYDSSFVYQPTGVPAAAAATAHLYDSPPQQRWSDAHGPGLAPGADANGFYDPRFDGVLPSVARLGGLDVDSPYMYKTRDDASLSIGSASSTGLEAAVAAAAAAAGPGGSHGILPSMSSISARSTMYQPYGRQSGIGHHGAGVGRSGSRSRYSSHSGSGRGGYPGYVHGNNGRHSGGGYGGRGVVVSDDLNAQAAAAAAAAAAAVYKSGGLHINTNGQGPLPPYQGNSGGSMSHRTLGGSGRSGKTSDLRRSGIGHDVYGRIGGLGMNMGVGMDIGGLGMGKLGTHHGSSQDVRDTYARGGFNRIPAGGDGGGSSGGSGYSGSSGNTSGSGGNAGGGAGNAKFSSFNDIVGRAEELARDQHGCRFLQTKLEEGNPMYINSIFEECYDKFVDLMTDPFGNYLCQKLFDHCNDAQRLALVERCAPDFPRVSTNMHGTRAVQRMVECLSTTQQVQAVCKALAPAAVALMKDINGNHVIQRCLHRMEPVHNQFVYDAVANNCFELATHRHGCCVMQRCMDYASPAQRNQLAKQINANALPLVQNPFGNYVVQYVLQLNNPTYTAEIIRRLRGHLAELSMQKFSSNVVEKSLQLGSLEVRRDLIFELISDPDTLKRLLHDAYGNYVIQRALLIAESPQLEQICEAIRPHLNSLRQSPYGKRIQAKIQKRMPKGLPTSIASS